MQFFYYNYFRRKYFKMAYGKRKRRRNNLWESGTE
nr:MAG TPA: hypothetical protein [Caudoviricetes sp.]